MRQFSSPYVPTLKIINKIILGCWVGFFLLDALVRLSTQFSLTSLFALTPGRVMGGEIYQLVSYPFFHVQMWDLLLHALVLVFMGTALEERWGSRQYAKFLAATTFFVGLFYLGLAQLFPAMQFLPLYGGGAWLFAMATTYALIEPEAMFSMMFLFPVKAKVAVALLLGLEIYSGIFSPLQQAAWANLTGALMAWLWVKGPQFSDVFSSSRKRNHDSSRRRSIGKSKAKLHLVDQSHEQGDESSDSKDAKRNRDPKYWQ